VKSLRVLVTAGVLLAISAVSASGATNLRQPSLRLTDAAPLSALGHRGLGRASGPASAAAISENLQRVYGLTSAQVSSQRTCSTPAAGQMGCDALELTNAATGAVLHPTFTPAAAGTSGSPQFLQQAYDLPYLSATAGGTQTVGIIDAYNDSTAASDLATYRSEYGLPAMATCTVGASDVASPGGPCLAVVSQSGSTTSLPPGSPSGDDWAAEESLDMDAVSALCPNCQIILVEATSESDTNLQTAAHEAFALGATEISESFGGVTASSGTDNSSEAGWTFSGVPVFAATGDSGYPGATESQVPAAYQDVNAVSGTRLSAGGATYDNRGFSESAWSTSSSEGTGSGCDTGETKPSFQTDTGCTGRSYGDVSADADPSTGLDVYSTYDGGWLQVGGTSLATPLVAAYSALTGAASTSVNAAWAYANSSLLNDLVSGSNGSCAADISYICTAGVGYDGPTGSGSIEGDITPGAPGIGGAWNGTTNPTNAVSTTVGSVTLEAGVYPNGLATTYYWQYGTTTQYGSTTPVGSLTAGSLPDAVQNTVALSPNSTYHFELVATNANGTEYGRDQTITTLSGAASTTPANSAAPTISGDPHVGDTLIASTGTWSPTGTAGDQWQHYSPARGWTNISGATSSSYVVAASDLGDPIDVIVTETGTGSSAAQSAPTTAVTASATPSSTAAPVISGTTTDGATLSASTGTWSPSGTVSYQWQRNTASGWTNIAGATSSTYTLTSQDVGAQIDVVVTETNSDGSGMATAASAGPVTEPPSTPVTPSQPTTPTSTQPTPTSDQPSTTTPSTTTPKPPTVTVPKVLVAPALSGPATLEAGSTITASSGTYSGAIATVQLFLCRVTCSPAAAAGVTTLKVTAADAGSYITSKVTVTASNGTSVTAWGTAVGPVKGANVAVGSVPAKSSVLRDGAGHPLARVTRRKLAGQVSITVTGVRGAPAATVRLCSVVTGSAVQCSSAVSLTRAGRVLTLTARTGARLQIVAVTRSPRG
jgi:hypothetical protein